MYGYSLLLLKYTNLLRVFLPLPPSVAGSGPYPTPPHPQLCRTNEVINIILLE